MKKNFKFLSALLCLVFLASCAMFSKMTPAQKELTYRTSFNYILNQFNTWAVKQPETTKVKLRADVIPLIDKATSALDKYEAAFTTGENDPQAKLDFYLGLKNDLIQLLLKYGLKVDEKEVSSATESRITSIGFNQSSWRCSTQSQRYLE